MSNCNAAHTFEGSVGVPPYVQPFATKERWKGSDHSPDFTTAMSKPPRETRLVIPLMEVDVGIGASAPKQGQEGPCLFEFVVDSPDATV